MASSLLIVYSNLDPGGIPAKIIDIVNFTGKKQQTPITIFLQKGHSKDLRCLISNPNVTIVDQTRPDQLLFIVRLWIYIFMHKPSSILVFVSPYAIPVLFSKLFFFWRKTAVVVSEDHYTETLIHTMFLPKLQEWGIRYLYPLANKVITPTQAIKNQLIHYFNIPDSKIQVVYNWSRYANDPLPKGRRTIDIIHIGRLVPSKNPMEIVQTMNDYILQNKKARCMIIGDGSEYDRVKEYIINHNLSKNISLMHAVKDVSVYLKKAKTFLFLPEEKTEGFPVILMDSVVCGTIIVSRRFFGSNEILTMGICYYVKKSKQHTLKQITSVINKYKNQSQSFSHLRYNFSKLYSTKNISHYISAFE